MKYTRVKKWMLAICGFAAYQVAGCNILEQFQGLLPNIPGFGG